MNWLTLVARYEISKFKVKLTVSSSAFHVQLSFQLVNLHAQLVDLNLHLVNDFNLVVGYRAAA